jgi:hypothetical protein
VLTDPDPGWKNLKSRLRLEGAELTASSQIEAAWPEHVRDTPHGVGANRPIVQAQQDHAPRARATSELPSMEPELRPNTKAEAAVSRERPTPPQWLVSKHRDELSTLESTLEQAKETHAQITQDAAEKAARIRKLDEQIQQIKTAARDDALHTKHRHRKDLEARQAARKEQLNQLSERCAQLPVPPDTQTLAEEFMAYQQQHQRQRESTIEDAAADEIEIGTPVFEQTLGPRPDPGSPARDVWNRAALQIGKHRVQRNITNPHQHGIDTSDRRSRKLAKEVDPAIEQLNRHWATQGLQLKITTIRGINQGRDHGIGM